MDEQTVRKTVQYKRKPPPDQERAMACIVRGCRDLYNAALDERNEAWKKCGVRVTEAMQSAQLPQVKEVRPAYRDLHSQVVQDVLTRLDRAFQRFFARVKNGEMPGYPRFQGSNRSHSFTSNQFGNGATVDGGGRRGHWLSGPLQDRAHCGPLVTSVGGRAQDGHDQPGSGWLGRMLFLS